jgi:glutaredoxin
MRLSAPKGGHLHSMWKEYAMTSRDLTVFTMPGCPYCAGVKDYLSQRGLDYVERNITRDETAYADLKALGTMSTPVVVLGDRVVVGFDRRRLDQLLED